MFFRKINETKAQEKFLPVTISEVLKTVEKELAEWQLDIARIELKMLYTALTKKANGEAIDFNANLALKNKHISNTSYIQIGIFRNNSLIPAQYLLENGCNVPSEVIFNIINDEFCTTKQFNKIFDLLIKHKLNINVVNQDQHTPLFVAKREHYIKAEKALLKHGAKMKFTEHLVNPFLNLREHTYIAANSLARKIK